MLEIVRENEKDGFEYFLRHNFAWNFKAQRIATTRKAKETPRRH